MIDMRDADEMDHDGDTGTVEEHVRLSTMFAEVESMDFFTVYSWLDHQGAESWRKERQGFGVQEWFDGSRYEGEFVNGLKHGKGRFTWTNGEYYEGSFYKDYRHGEGLYCWPTGHKFIGKFYLNRKEGYAQQLFPNGASFQGLYRADHRFGPGVLSYPDGRQDVGLWQGGHLIRLCTALDEAFTLKNFPEYAAFMDSCAKTDSLTQPPRLCSNLPTEADTQTEEPAEGPLLLDERFIYPPGMESYSTDGDHLPLPPGRRREFDQQFFGDLWEPDVNQYQGYRRDPLSALPLRARMHAHIYKHRRQAENMDWDVAAVLSLNRQSFGPKGPLEVDSERLMEHAARGDTQAVCHVLGTGLIHPNVADSQGHTALIAATANFNNDVINLLLNMGAEIDKLNCEGMSALAVCHVLYYPFQSLHTSLIRSPANIQSLSEYGNSNQTSPAEPQSTDTTLSSGNHLSDQAAEVRTVSHHSSKQSNDRELSNDRCPAVNEVNEPETTEKTKEERTGREDSGNGEETEESEEEERKSVEKWDRRRLDTLMLLLERGADPNASQVPMPVLFLATMGADIEAVKRLLECGAHADIHLPPEIKGFYPLHLAASLPGSAGPRITELLLQTDTDPDARACDQDDIYEQDWAFMRSQEPQSRDKRPQFEGGSRTALHIACQRDSHYEDACDMINQLLSRNVSIDLLWSGHTPLSLAIASGNEQAVEELLKVGADPNMTLSCGLSSPLCALANINYHPGGNKLDMLHMLIKAGADILMPVVVGDSVGTAVDYAHYSFNQDLRIAKTPFRALRKRERDIFIARQQLLTMMADLLRQAVTHRTIDQLTLKVCRRRAELELTESDSTFSHESNLSSKSQPKTTEKHRKPLFEFCYQCGRSAFVKLVACKRCRKVSYCSRMCKLRAWDAGHKEECSRERTTGRKGKKDKRSLVLASEINPLENYSRN